MMNWMYKISLLTLVLFFSNCHRTGNGSELRLTGMLSPTGMTSYQYGTHTLTTEDHIYALKSEEINLENYENQRVSIRGTMIQGYPVDGGPPYLMVVEIEPAP